MAVLNTDKPHAGLIVQHAGQAESILLLCGTRWWNFCLQNME